MDFTDLSALTPSGPATAWTWDFGDGGTSATQNFWALSQILACADAGIVSGYADGSYRPDLVVTRDAMAVFISRGLAGGDGNVPTGPVSATFTDVPTDHWAYRYVEYAHAEGVVGGYWNGTYRPALPVDRAQMAVFVSRAMAGGDANVPDDPDATPFFPDVPDTHWAYEYVEYCHDQGVVGGYWDGYRPNEVVNRAQMAVYVARASRSSVRGQGLGNPPEADNSPLASLVLRAESGYSMKVALVKAPDCRRP